jgi:hypothetical protein
LCVAIHVGAAVPESVKIFISCVSNEFRAYRDELRSKLTRHNVEVKVQEDFKGYGTATLDKLDTYIRACDAVIHIVGDMTGAAAKPASTQAITRTSPSGCRRWANCWRAVRTSPTPSGRRGSRSITARRW